MVLRWGGLPLTQIQFGSEVNSFGSDLNSLGLEGNEFAEKVNGFALKVNMIHLFGIFIWVRGGGRVATRWRGGPFTQIQLWLEVNRIRVRGGSIRLGGGVIEVETEFNGVDGKWD